LARPPLHQLGGLDDRSLDLLVPEALRKCGGGSLRDVPAAGLGRQDVANSAGGTSRLGGRRLPILRVRRARPSNVGAAQVNLAPDPIKQFGLWYQAALDAGAQQPEAMALATSTRAGRPSNRLGLLKGWSERVFAFYTNLGSRKGQELAANPRVALAIYWREVGRQVRAAGRVSRLSRRDAAAYWETRPVESQAAAWVSPQSHVIESREWLEAMYSETLERLAGGQIPL